MTKPVRKLLLLVAETLLQGRADTCYSLVENFYLINYIRRIIYYAVNRRPFYEFKTDNLPGFPDGMTIDDNEDLWIASYLGAQVNRLLNRIARSGLLHRYDSDLNANGKSHRHVGICTETYDPSSTQRYGSRISV